jgi:hypothetical protein
MMNYKNKVSKRGTFKSGILKGHRLASNSPLARIMTEDWLNAK